MQKEESTEVGRCSSLFLLSQRKFFFSLREEDSEHMQIQGGGLFRKEEMWNDF